MTLLRGHPRMCHVFVVFAIVATLSAVSEGVALAALTEVDVAITDGIDDAEQRADGSMKLTSSDLELVEDAGSVQIVGLRFPALGIPQGATILEATLQFTVDETTTEAASLTISAAASDTAPPFSTAALDISSRGLSAPRVTWDPPPWTTVGARGAEQLTPNLASLVQAVISRPGWASGNAIAFIIKGSGSRVADSYEGGASRAPSLHVEYEPAAPSVVSSVAALTPESGSPGTVVSIDGSGFAGTTQVAFNGIPASFSMVSDALLVASVPLTATSGRVAVTNAFGTAFSAGDFTVDPIDPLEVPSEYPTIQAAIDAAIGGDTVLVAPGTYPAGVVVNKTITLASHYRITGDPATIAATIIQSDGTVNGIVVTSNVGPSTTIEGFTVTGVDTNASAGLDGISVGATVEILDNHITKFGDGIDFDPPLPAVASCICKRNTIYNNSDDAIDLDGAAEALIEDNILRDNGDDGIEIRMQDHAGPLHVVIRNNVITGNGQDGIQLIDEPGESDRRIVIQGNVIADNRRAGLGLMDNSATTEDYRAASLLDSIHLINNTFSGNNHAVSGGDNVVALNNIFVGSDVAIKGVDGNSIVAHSLFSTNLVDVITSNVDGSTRIDADPLLDANFRLLPDSPATNAGTAHFVWQGVTVLDAQPGTYTGSAPDLGAFGLLDAPDTTPPSVVAVDPSDGESDVSQGRPVLATFSEAMNADSITSMSLVLRELGSSLPVSSTVTYNASSLIGTLSPDQPLMFSTTYEVTIVGGSSGVADTVGNPLGQDFIWTFSTAGEDITAPETTIDSGPDDPTSDTFAILSFSSDESNSSFECSLDDGAFTLCDPPQVLTGLQDGSHNFRTRATDPAGNVDLSPAIWTWVVDTSVVGTQFPAAGDATVLGSDPDANFGAATSLMADLSPVETSYVQFDVVGLSGLVTSAELRVFATSRSTNGPAVYEVDNGWTEGLVTYNTAPARISGLLDTAGAITSGSWVVYDVAQSILGNGLVSFELGAQSSDGVDFHSREAVDPNRPMLVVITNGSASLPQVTVVASDNASAEPGGDTGTFTVGRTGSTDSALVVSYSVGGTASPGTDYTALPGTVTIPIGQISQEIIVTPLDDTAAENPESVVLTLIPDIEYLVGAASSDTVTISDDGDLAEVSIVATDAIASEPGSDTATFTVTRTGPTDSALAALYSVTGTATPGVDYTAVSGSATIPIGQTTVSITVEPIDDTELESPETVTLSLTADSAYVVGTPGSDTVTINDNDGGAEIRFTAVADTYVDQGAPATNFGTASSLSVDGNTGSSEEALVRFDVSGVAGPVQSATLRVYVTNSTANGPQVILTEIAWAEGAVTWNDKPATTGAVLFDAGAVPSGAWFEMDVTSGVTGNGTYSFGLFPQSNNGLDFSSREASSLAPELVVIASTEPDTTPPDVISTTPTDAATDVSVGAVVRATFSEPMDPSTFDSSSFALSDGVSPVSATVEYDSATSTASLIPEVALRLAQTYVATITTAVTDAVGNSLATTAVWTFVTETTDTTPPETVILLGPAIETSATTATFTFSADEAGAAFLCALDSTPATACTSPISYTSLAAGNHQFDVIATDAAGNSDPIPATWNWTITSKLTFVAVADTYVTDRRASTNYGTAKSLESDARPNNKEIYIRFDVSGISFTVQSVVLRVFVTNGTGNGPEVFPAANSWDELTMTWDTKASRTGAALVDAAAIPIGAWYEFDVSGYITGDGVYSFNLASTSSDALKFDSREVGGSQPHLVVRTQ